MNIEQWFKNRVEPDLTAVKTDVAKALAYARAHAAQEEAIANLLVKIVSAADPALAPVLAALVPEAEALLAEAEKRIAELSGTGM